MIRKAEITDLPVIEAIYETARAYMRANGNPHQWSDYGYPERELLENDIRHGQLYVIEETGRPHGVFAFILGDDPTYAYIDGAWPNDRPYGTIHHIASDGQLTGIFTRAFEFVLDRIGEIRVDTHFDNKTMQHVIQKHGFRRCGVIYLQSGDPRIAYQYSKEDSP